MLKLRKNFLPKLLSEFVALGFVFFILPAIYIFELSIAVPAYYAQDVDSWWPCIHNIVGTYVMFNLLGNLIGAIFVDTSFKKTAANSPQVKSIFDGNYYLNWMFYYFTYSRLPKKGGTFVLCVKYRLLLEHGTAMYVMYVFWKGNIIVGSQAAVLDSTTSVSFFIFFFTYLSRPFMQHISPTPSYGHQSMKPTLPTLFEYWYPYP